MTATKDSGIEWIGQIPESWMVKPFYAVGNQIRTRNSSGKTANLLSLSYGEIKEKDIDSTDGLLPESFDTYQEIKPDDLVFRFTDLQNDKRSLRSAVSGFNGIITSAYLAFRPKAIHPKYLGYLMRFYDTTKVFYSMGSGLRQSLKYADVRRMPVLVPPIEVQKAIADFLDSELKQIDILLEKQSKLVTTLTARRQATIDEYLGSVPHGNVSKACRLKDVATVFASNVDKKVYDEGIPVALCNYVDVYYNDFITEGLPFMEATATRSEIAKFQLKGNWVILTKDSESELDIGISAFVEKDIPGVVCGYHLAILEPRFDVDGLYLKWVLDSSAAKSHFARRANGLTRMALGRDAIATLPVTIPLLTDQQLISRRIKQATSEIDRLIRESKNLTSLLNERKRSLVSEVVTGKLDFRGRN